jgi:phosphatidate cytidylyltransferase
MSTPAGTPAKGPPTRRQLRQTTRRAAAGRTAGSDPADGGDAAPTAGRAPGEAAPAPATAAAPAGAPTTGSRAGRDLPVAIGVGLGLGAVLLLSLFVRKEAFVALAVIAVGGALWEFAAALRSRGIRVPLRPLLVGSTGMLLSAFVAGPEALVVAFMLTAGGVFVWRVIDGGGTDALRDAGAGIFAAAYMPFLAAFAVLMIAAPDGAWRVLYAISLVVANDVGGYAAGVFFGRHPMAPTVSPKKSWEGAAGSAVLAAVVGVGLMWWFFDGPLWAGAAIGLLTVAAATVGDLSESLIKRDLGLKDMGTLLPGHGGIMDRLDSMLVAAPIVYGSLTLTLALPR